MLIFDFISFIALPIAFHLVKHWAFSFARFLLLFFLFFLFLLLCFFISRRDSPGGFCLRSLAPLRGVAGANAGRKKRMQCSLLIGTAKRVVIGRSVHVIEQLFLAAINGKVLEASLKG